ncbi:vacuolar-type H+-ATPase subunit E/Vma4 [Olsenella profusa DSM 13989]|uniref:hypothetical protein n=1 Tax=Olsenella profusa TaxID=138595 RepID=UPI0027849D97|nr:hypothetical protein [Olsenella profusa]MDP9860163.1 vacuolar-type H+-ATPase subunit E/Vma4 [Olsenella profusa DSM 13989]
MIEESIGVVQEAEARAATVVAEAQERAKRIRHEAELQAQDIKAQAHDEARSLRAAAELQWRRDEAEALSAARDTSLEDADGTGKPSDERVSAAVAAAKELALS